MRPAIRSGLIELNTEFRDKLTIRVSVDHFDQAVHEKERGSGSWAPMVEGLRWLSENNFQIAVAGQNSVARIRGRIERGVLSIFQKERNKHRCMESQGAYSLPRDGRRFQRA